MNHHLFYLKGIFTILIKFKKWDGENPLELVHPMSFDQRELTYLSDSEIKALMAEAEKSKNESLPKVIMLCIATGARWSEAEKIEAEQIVNGIVTYGRRTKSGKRRSIPVEDEVIDFINPKKIKRGRLFENCYQAFKNALDRAGIELPKGQKTHVLRHSFASHYIIDGGDILLLNKALGHSTYDQTLIYAHLSPKHLSDIKNRNPSKLFF